MSRESELSKGQTFYCATLVYTALNAGGKANESHINFAIPLA